MNFDDSDVKIDRETKVGFGLKELQFIWRFQKRLVLSDLWLFGLITDPFQNFVVNYLFYFHKLMPKLDIRRLLFHSTESNNILDLIVF